MNKLPVVTLLFAALLGGCDDFKPVSKSGYGAFEPALAVIDHNLAVAWNDNRNGNDEIYLRLLDHKLQPLSEEIRLTNSKNAAYEADLVVFGGNMVVAWYDRNQSGHLQARVGMWTPTGEQLWQHDLAGDDHNSRVPLLEVVGNKLFLAWMEEAQPLARGAAVPGDNSMQTDSRKPGIYGAWLDQQGTYLIDSFLIAEASTTTWNLNADALPDGRIALVYDAKVETKASELYLALVDGSSVTTKRLTADDGHDSKYPDIAIGSTATALTWFDNSAGNNEVYLAVVPQLTQLLGQQQDSQQHNGNNDLTAVAHRITNTAGESIGAYLVWNGNSLGLAWNDNDVGQNEIYFQRFDSSGNSTSAAKRLTDTPADSMIPAIVAFDDGFALGWNEVILAGKHDGNQSSTRSEVVVRYQE